MELIGQDDNSPVLPASVKNYLIDIDGTITEDVPNEDRDRMITCEPFPDAVKTINRWYDQGHRICFFTSRTEELKKITEEWLNRHGFKFHSVLCGKPRGGNYHWIDNHTVKATQYIGKFTDFVETQATVEIFKE